MNDIDDLIRHGDEQTTPGGIILVTAPEPDPEPKPPSHPPGTHEDLDANGNCPVCGSDSPHNNERTCMGAGNKAHCNACGWWGVDITWRHVVEQQLALQAVAAGLEATRVRTADED